jgi:hypothetical protein
MLEKKHNSKKSTLKKKQVVIPDLRLTKILMQIFDMCPGINAPTRKLLVEGFQRCNKADYEGLDRDKITIGWKHTGLVPYDPRVILDNCERIWRDGEIELVLSKLDEYAAYFVAHGNLPDAKMDADNMPKSDDDKSYSRDDLVDFRQRCLIMNHVQVIDARNVYEDNRDAANAKKAAQKLLNDALGALHYNTVYASIVRGDTTWKNEPKTFMTGVYKHLKLNFTRPLPVAPKLKDDLATLIEGLITSTIPPPPAHFNNIRSNPSPSITFTSLTHLPNVIYDQPRQNNISSLPISQISQSNTTTNHHLSKRRRIDNNSESLSN